MGWYLVTTLPHSRCPLRHVPLYKQICAKQQRELELLHVVLEGSQELKREHEKAAPGRR